MPKPPSYPSGRYTRTNPLRREGGLRLLTGSLPDPLHWSLIHAWRHPSLFDGQHTPTALQHPQRQRLDDAALAQTRPRALAWFTLTELEIARRLVEAPQASILPATRNSMLSAQGAYLLRLYVALARQIGEAAALAEFLRLLASVG
jgi:hypothetical protein